MTASTSESTPHTSATVRHLVVAQGLYIGGSAVDLTLTGIVGARLAPVPALATLPFSSIFVISGLSTFLVARAIGRFGHRRVFVAAAAVAMVSGCVSALAIELGAFWLFAAGTSLIGVYAATAGYYRYLAADSTQGSRARAVSTVLAGGLVAALVGPFAATALRDVTATPFVASYLLVAVLGLAAAFWNRRLPVPPPVPSGPSVAVGPAPRRASEIWRQPPLLLGTAAAVLAAASMLSMMTAGPLLGMAVGHSAVEAALAIQLHLVGMYAPGFLVVRVIGRFGETHVVLAGIALLLLAGLAAVAGTGLALYLLSMALIGVGWNLAYSGGTALITTSYATAERGRVQPVAEFVIITAQVGGSLVAALFATRAGWTVLGTAITSAAACLGTVVILGGAAGRRRPAA